MPSPRHRFQTLGIDLLAAGDALPENTLADAVQRTLDHLQQLTFIIALVEEEFLVVRAGCPVGDILRRILVCAAPILLGTRHVPPQFLLPAFQPDRKSTRLNSSHVAISY